MQLHLKRFDISTIPDDATVVLIGKRNTGKSTLVLDLLKQHRDIPLGTVVSPTETANHFYGDIVPCMFIHEEVSPTLLANVVKRQQIAMREIHRAEQAYGKDSRQAKAIDPRAFLILDDCMYDSHSWVKDKNMRYILMNGRHIRVFFVLCMQYPLGIPPILRAQLDYIFVLREQVVSNRKRIYDNYAGMFPSFEVFCQVMDQTTENFECLVIKNNAKSNKLEDQVFWYKADIHEPYKIGARQYWKLSKEIQEQQDERDADNEEFDAHTIRKKKGPLISVMKGYDGIM